MMNLALLFWTVFAPFAGPPATLGGGGAFAPGTDPCAVARQIAEQAPCLRSEDCGAVHAWADAFGTPRQELLVPTVTAAGEVEIEVTPRPRQVRRSWPCRVPASGPDPAAETRLRDDD